MNYFAVTSPDDEVGSFQGALDRLAFEQAERERRWARQDRFHRRAEIVMFVFCAVVAVLVLGRAYFASVTSADAIMAGANARAEAILAAAAGKDEARLARKYRSDLENCMSQFAEYHCVALLRQHRAN